MYKPGDMVHGRYQVVRLLSDKGGFGTVYQVHDVPESTRPASQRAMCANHRLRIACMLPAGCSIIEAASLPLYCWLASARELFSDRQTDSRSPFDAISSLIFDGIPALSIPNMKRRLGYLRPQPLRRNKEAEQQ
jgi:serine/threonine protein kinase